MKKSVGNPACPSAGRVAFRLRLKGQYQLSIGDRRAGIQRTGIQCSGIQCSGFRRGSFKCP